MAEGAQVINRFLDQKEVKQALQESFVCLGKPWHRVGAAISASVHALFEAEAVRRGIESKSSAIVTVHIVEDNVACTTVDGETVADFEPILDAAMLRNVHRTVATCQPDATAVMLITVAWSLLDGPGAQALTVVIGQTPGSVLDEPDNQTRTAAVGQTPSVGDAAVTQNVVGEGQHSYRSPPFLFHLRLTPCLRQCALSTPAF